VRSHTRRFALLSDMSLPKVLRTKITPPQKNRRTLPRSRVSRALSESRGYRLTILQAGAGYGKSTALTVFVEQYPPFIWYQITEDDSDPLVFLLHLCHATRKALPDIQGLPISMLEAWEGIRGPLPTAGVVDQFLNALNESLQAPIVLILDDVHLALSSAEIAHILDRMIGLAPHYFHILLATRPPLKLPNLSRWRAQGDVLTLDQSVLAFTVEEILELFSRHYGYELTRQEAGRLQEATEGWAIALQLIWQNLRSGSSPSIEESFSWEASSLEGLFEILAGEVFEGQPTDVQEFMLASATLREMTASSCDAVRGAGDSAAMLSYLQRQELFVVELENGPGSSPRLRYHHIFHDFLRQQTSPERRRAWHMLAGEYFLTREDLDEAIYHLIIAEDYQGAATLLDTYGSQLLLTGRLDTLAAALDSMPPEVLGDHPALLCYLGDLARLHSRFREALGWYQQAETTWRERGKPEGISRALRGQARVYLDTVDPSGAEEILQRALRLSDGTDDRKTRARLYELLAENKLNAGNPGEAERLRQQAAALRQEGPSDSQLYVRVLLRTGRLEEARRDLEEMADSERRQPVHVPRSHRETLLLISLIYAFQGRPEQAFQTALEGTQRGKELNSPFVTGVGHARQGHALMLRDIPERYTLARQQFETSVQQSRDLAIPRLSVEPLWGLCRAYGYQGDLTACLRHAHTGIEIADQAGDEWIAALIRLAVGASYTLEAISSPVKDFAQAEDWLNRAVLGFQECNDPFGLSAARLWLCLAWRHQKNNTRLSQTLPEVLKACQENGYDYLLTRSTLLGPPDERILAPLLITAREKGWQRAYARRLLKDMGLPAITLHPGYQLRVRTLGGFQVWRGQNEIPNNGWQREKARQLFQVLLTHRMAPLDRDLISEHLWPGQDPEGAQRNFKVALSTLYKVLEPHREPGSDSAYILREGSTYGLRPEADLWLDTRAFTQAIQQAERSLREDPHQVIPLLESALALYEGEYLPDARYETWSAAEREHLSVLFLRAADQLAELYLQVERYADSIEVCQRILMQDDCWERAYRHLMTAFSHLGDRGQVARTYRRCRQRLREELEVSPSAETVSLYKKLTRDL
jgi:LuxR family maltose regulon positive regulatory protein